MEDPSPLWLTLASDFAFANLLSPGAGTADLGFTCVRSAPLSGALERSEPVYASRPYPEGGESEIFLYRLGDCWVVRFTGISDFYLWPERILCHPQDASQDPGLRRNPAYHRIVVEVQLLGIVLACWLELQGLPALHASAVVVTVARWPSSLLGGREELERGDVDAGRSSAARGRYRARRVLQKCVSRAPRLPADAYVAGAGRALLGPPRGPRDRLSGLLQAEGPGRGERPRILLWRGASSGLPDLPERREVANWGLRTEITPVPRREALMALIGHSFVPHLVEAMGLQSRRLGFLAEMTARVPVRRVIYPSGLEHLPLLRRAILDDLSSLSRVMA